MQKLFFCNFILTAIKLIRLDIIEQLGKVCQIFNHSYSALYIFFLHDASLSSKAVNEIYEQGFLGWKLGWIRRPKVDYYKSVNDCYKTQRWFIILFLEERHSTDTIEPESKFVAHMISKTACYLFRLQR